MLTDGHLEALLDQLADVALCRMEGDTAHGGPLGLPAVSARKGQLQHAGGSDGIVKEHLVEISETVEHKEILVLIFDLKILLHHGGHDTFLFLTSN